MVPRTPRILGVIVLQRFLRCTVQDFIRFPTIFYWPIAFPDNHILNEPLREPLYLRPILAAVHNLLNQETRFVVNLIGHRRILLASGIAAFAVWLQQLIIEHRMN